MPQNNKYPDSLTDESQLVETASRGADIGSLLRRRREDMGLDLTAVSTTLRIRRNYLGALENNTIEGLPGPTYATGFLRAYADYLGLDSNEVVRRFKAGKTALYDKTELTFPMPLTERGIPGGGLFLLTTIILIGLGYGTWYYMSSKEHATPEAVESVPQQLAELVQHPSAPAKPPAPVVAAAPAKSVPPSAPAPSGGATTATAPRPAASSPPSTTPPAAAPSVTPAPAETATATPAPAASPPIAATQPQVVVDGGATPLQGAQNDIGTPDAAPPTDAPTTPPADSSAPAIAAVPAAIVPPAPAPTVHVYGAAQPSHIVVKAIGSSWIQVRGPDDHVLTMRVLKPGDSYNAPDMPGLIMRTGNAGALQFYVDGKNLPPIGRIGEVKQHIRLDPQLLAQGAADQ